jgi:putative flippase GtrA
MDTILIVLSDFNIENLDRILNKIVGNIPGECGLTVVIPGGKPEENGRGAIREMQISGLNVKILFLNEISSRFVPDEIDGTTIRYIFSLTEESVLGTSPFNISESIRQMENGQDIIVGVSDVRKNRQPFPEKIMEKIEKIILFPDIGHPFSRTYACTSEVCLTGRNNFSGLPDLPELLVKVQWNTISEERYSPGKTQEPAPCRSSGAGLFQVFNFILYGLKNRDSHIRHELGNVFRFGIVGLSGIFVNCGLLYLLTEYFGFFYLVSSAVAIEVSIVSNFLLNDHWTFRNRETRRVTAKISRFLSFQCVAMGGMLINISVLFFLTDFFGIYYIFSNIIGILVTFSWNFIVNRNITWRST